MKTMNRRPRLALRVAAVVGVALTSLAVGSSGASASSVSRPVIRDALTQFDSLHGAPPAGAAPVTGLVEIKSFSALDAQPAKSAHADCPAGKRVISGSAAIFANPIHNQFRLVDLHPVHPGSGADGFIGGYQAIGTITDNWEVEVDALCADPIPGMYLATGSGQAGSTTVQSAEARCAPGDVVLGGGGLVRNPGFQADLRTVAPSASGDRFIVQGGEDVDGYTQTWSVNAYAMCAPRPPGYQIVVAVGGRGTAPRKTQTATCPAGTRAHGVGASTDPAAPGGVGLEYMFVQSRPSNGAQGLAVMTENVTVDWGIFRVFAICAT
jgi:hypothetical protein